MPVTIDQLEVESARESAPANSAQPEPPKPDPRELERALNQRRTRLERVRAH